MPAVVVRYKWQDYMINIYNSYEYDTEIDLRRVIYLSSLFTWPIDHRSRRSGKRCFFFPSIKCGGFSCRQVMSEIRHSVKALALRVNCWKKSQFSFVRAGVVLIRRIMIRVNAPHNTYKKIEKKRNGDKKKTFILLANHPLAEDGNKCDKNSDIEFCAENMRGSSNANWEKL